MLMLKLECEVIDRNPDFKMQGRDYLRQIDYDAGTVRCGTRCIPCGTAISPPVTRQRRQRLNADERLVLDKLVASFRQGSEKLQKHVDFLYAKGSVYHIENGYLLYHGAVPMTDEGNLPPKRLRAIPCGAARCWITVTCAPAWAILRRRARRQRQAGRTFCGICGAASSPRCLAAAP